MKSIKKNWVPGYTKADGTVVHGYESSRSKKQEGPSQTREKKQEDIQGPEASSSDETPQPSKVDQAVVEQVSDSLPSAGPESDVSSDDIASAAASILTEIGDDDLVELSEWAKGIQGGEELLSAIEKAKAGDTNGKLDGEDLPNLEEVASALKELADSGAADEYEAPSEQDIEKQVQLNQEAAEQWASEYSKEEIDNRVSDVYQPDITADSDGDGIADYSKVGVPAHVVPPPPGITRMPNLTKAERFVEQSFIEWFESNPDAATGEYRRQLAEGKIGDGPNVFGTDDAKLLNPVYTASLENRAKYNVALHQTANAIAKRAFVDHLDQVVMNLPEDQRHVLITAGGVAAGKGYALSQNKEVNAIATAAAAVWDSAGEQNSTEMAWVASELRKRGINGTFVYVHADPSQKWENPKFGAVQRAKGKGRMVDAHLFADSYVQGAENFKKFHEANLGAEDMNIVYIDSTTPEMTKGDTMPEGATSLDREQVYDRSVKYLLGSDSPDHIKRGGSVGMRVWGNPSSISNNQEA